MAGKSSNTPVLTKQSLSQGPCSLSQGHKDPHTPHPRRGRPGGAAASPGQERDLG